MVYHILPYMGNYMTGMMCINIYIYISIIPYIYILHHTSDRGIRYTQTLNLYWGWGLLLTPQFSRPFEDGCP